MSVIFAFLAAAPWLIAQSPKPGSPAARRNLAEFADCVIRSAPRKSKKIVEGKQPLRTEDDNFRLLARACINPLGGDRTILHLSDIQLRFQLADAFIRKDRFMRLPALQSRTPLNHDAAERTDVAPENKAFDRAISSFGECVVRAAPDTATSLVRSGLSTAEEAKALTAITPVLSACLTDGMTFTFSPEVVRGTVALNYYRLASASVDRTETVQK